MLGKKTWDVKSGSDLKEFTRSSRYEQKRTPWVRKERKEQTYGEAMVLIEDSDDGDGGDYGDDGW